MLVGWLSQEMTWDKRVQKAGVGAVSGGLSQEMTWDKRVLKAGVGEMCGVPDVSLAVCVIDTDMDTDHCNYRKRAGSLQHFIQQIKVEPSRISQTFNTWI